MSELTVDGLPRELSVVIQGEELTLVAREHYLHQCKVNGGRLVCMLMPAGLVLFVVCRYGNTIATGEPRSTVQEAADSLASSNDFKRWAPRQIAVERSLEAKLRHELFKKAARAARLAAADRDQEWEMIRELTPPDAPGVYVVAGVPGWVKIGRAQNIRKRVAALQNGHPVPVRLIAILSDNPKEELSFHYRFKKLRSHGEWFRVDDDMRDVILEANRSYRRGYKSLLWERA